MSENEDAVVEQVHSDAYENLVDMIIKHHIDNRDFFPAEHAAKFRKDGKLKEEEADFFIREFTKSPTYFGKRFEQAAEIAENHHVSRDTLSWLAKYSAEHGKVEALQRTCVLLERDPTTEELNVLYKNLRKR